MTKSFKFKYGGPFNYLTDKISKKKQTTDKEIIAQDCFLKIKKKIIKTVLFTKSIKVLFSNLIKKSLNFSGEKNLHTTSLSYVSTFNSYARKIQLILKIIFYFLLNFSRC